MSETNDFDILLVGLDQATMDLLKPSFDQVKWKALATSADVENFLENFQLISGTRVFISSQTPGMTHFEVGQALSSYYQGLHLVFLTYDRNKFEIEKLKKNGFTDSFLLPLDSKNLGDILEEVKVQKIGGGLRKYKAVKLIDVQAGQTLPFEVRTFLPFNNKYVVLTGSGQLSAKKTDILKQKNINSVYIDTKELDTFYEYSADQLISAGASSNDAVSETEKSEKMRTNVRELFRSVLDASNAGGNFESGRDLLDQSKKIVEKYVEKKTGQNITDKLRTLIGEGRDSYSHAQIVSTMAALLSMATEIGQPEDLAIAGLFHDIGIYGLRDDTSVFEMDALGPDDKKKYMEHPRNSLNLLKEKKITLTPKIADIIERHHERIDAKGFPGQMAAHRIPLEDHLLAYADAVEYLTRPRPGQPVPTAAEAHKIISEKLGLSPEVLIKVQKFITSMK